MRIALLTTDAREPKKEYDKPEPYFGTAPEALLEGFKALGTEVEIHVVSCLQQHPVSSPGKLADNIHFHALHVPKFGWLRTGYQGCIRAARRKLREITPDIVHGQGTERDCAISAVLSGFPNVLTIHGNMRMIAGLNNARPFSFYWWAARLERFTLARTAGVVAISTYTRDIVAALTRRTWLVPNAVHPSFFDITPSPSSPPVVLCVANVDARKNQLSLIEALDALHPSTELRLVFAGGGHTDNPYFVRFLEEVRKRPWCSHAGSLGRAELREALACSSIAVLPSLEDNCPMVVLEAEAAGVPVAASRVGGIPDLIRHGETGLLFDPVDAGGTRDAIASLLASPDNARRLATKARTEALARFAPAAVARKHLEIYHEVLARI